MLRGRRGERRTPQWRHQRIVQVETLPDGGGFAFADDQQAGWLSVASRYAIEPHVGEPVSYYGHFGDDLTTTGHTIEALIIGERLVWDKRAEYARPEEPSQP